VDYFKDKIKENNMEKIYDLIILGGGPGSMSAGIYASQMKLDTLVIEKGEFGGQVATTSSVSNYLGFPQISGKELSQKMYEHLQNTSVEIAQEEITKTELDGDIKVIYTHQNKYLARACVIGIGTSARKLGVPDEQKYIGHGLSYLALRDRDKFAGKDIAVVGGGNSAIEDALYLAEKCNKVYLVHRRNEFRADPMLVELLKQKISEEGKIALVLECKPESLVGETSLNGFNIIHIPTGETRHLDVEGVFVAIGRGADTDIIDEKVNKDQSGYIITNEKMQTNLDGVYAIGDIRNTPLRQIVTAVADGALSIISAFEYLKSKEKNL